MDGVIPGTRDYSLSIGPNGDSVSYTALTGIGYSFLGESWRADVGLGRTGTLDYAFNALEVVDQNAPIVTDLELDLFFHTDRQPLFYGSQSASSPACIACLNSYSWTAGSDPDPEGGYFAWLYVFSHAETTDGGNAFSHQLHAVIAEAPEPSTWMLMLAGFAGLGAALRSHRQRLAAA